MSSQFAFHRTSTIDIPSQTDIKLNTTSERNDITLGELNRLPFSERDIQSTPLTYLLTNMRDPSSRQLLLRQVFDVLKLATPVFLAYLLSFSLSTVK